MSTAIVLMPQLHQPRPTGLFVAASSPIATAAAAIDPTRRKGPHRLRLVQACAVEPAAPTDNLVQMPLRVQPQLAFYRVYTEAMLQRYFKMSFEAGRVSSLLGQDMFKGRVSNCKVTGFDDVVIFVEDVNKCLAQLDPGQRLLIRRIALEGYTHSETAAMHGLALRTVYRKYEASVDRLTRFFLDRNLMKNLEDPATTGSFK